jgi:hypothetical protein
MRCANQSGASGGCVHGCAVLGPRRCEHLPTPRTPRGCAMFTMTLAPAPPRAAAAAVAAADGSPRLRDRDPGPRAAEWGDALDWLLAAGEPSVASNRRGLVRSPATAPSPLSLLPLAHSTGHAQQARRNFPQCSSTRVTWGAAGGTAGSAPRAPHHHNGTCNGRNPYGLSRVPGCFRGRTPNIQQEPLQHSASSEGADP